MRVAVPHWEDAEALVAIAAKSTVPVVADIHFQWKYAMAALEAGIQGLRINPGNIKYHDKVRLIAREAKARGVPIRIGVNAGSLEKDLLAKYGAPTPEALVESAMNEARILEDEDFLDIKISVKHSNAAVMIEAYRQLAEACDYPLHLGVTEAGPMPLGGVKCAVGIGTLLAEGIGDTIRVSLTDDPVEEVKVGNAILQSLGLRERGLDLVACPSCGRAEVNVLELTKKVEAAIEAEEFDVPMRVAVMGCVVNGPGEAREADVGIASGNGLGFVIRRRRDGREGARGRAGRRVAGRGANGRRREGRRPRGLTLLGVERQARRRARPAPCPTAAVAAHRGAGRDRHARPCTATTTRRCRSTRGSEPGPASGPRPAGAAAWSRHTSATTPVRTTATVGDAGGVTLVAIAVERQRGERQQPRGRLQ